MNYCLEDIIKRFRKREEKQNREVHEKKERANEDALKATEMRKRSLETFSETEKRNLETTPKRQRNNGSDTLSYLSQRYEVEPNLRRKELALRRQALDNTQTAMRQQSDLLAVLIQNQRQQQAVLVTFKY